MRRTSRNRRHAAAGFTLIELMLVIVIIATLAAVVAMNVVGKSNEGRIGAAKAQIATFEQCLAQFEADCGRFPTTAEGLDALRTPQASIKGWKGPYLTKDVPNDPWGNPYQYRSPGQHGVAGQTSTFDIWSNGPDGQEGTPDDIQNWALDKKDQK